MPKPILIVVADDDNAMRNMLSASLRQLGFDVQECDDGSALLERLEAAREGSAMPDLVVSDIQMPGATGLDVLHWVQVFLPELPLILITAFGDPQVHRRASELGAALVIDKPFRLQDLHDCVHDVLSCPTAR